MKYTKDLSSIFEYEKIKDIMRTFNMLCNLSEIKHKKIESFYPLEKKELSTKILIIDLIFYQLSGAMFGDYTPKNIINHVEKTLDFLFNDKKLGFVNTIENNYILIIFAILFSEDLKSISKKSIKHVTTKINWIEKDVFNLEHLYNLIFLTLIKDIVISEKIFKESNQEIYYDLKPLREKILSKLSGGLRSSITKNRFTILERCYTGFDTEFTTKENRKNSLLACSLSIYPMVFIRIKKLLINYNITNLTSKGSTKTPYFSNYIEFLILWIRTLQDRKDKEIEILINSLKKNENIRVLDQEDSYLFTVKKDLSVSDFINVFKDFRKNKSKYSLNYILETSKVKSLKIREKDYEILIDLSSKYLPDFRKIFKLERKFEIYLIAHYTPADVSLWSDFESIKESLNILKKSFVTLNRSFIYEKCSIFLRDTSLLTPTQSASLGTISKLYKEQGLEKIEITKENKSEMGEFMKEDFELFKKYSMIDSQITLYHALMVQESCYLYTKKFNIPVTLSSLSLEILYNFIGGKDYEIPTNDGRFNIHDLPQTFTPIGVEMSNNLTEFLPFYLGSYHGGRNESYIYGITEGIWIDYDVSGAYSTALSLLQYPDYKKGRVIRKKEILDNKDLIWSYTALHIKFKFPDTVQYPNLPVRLDIGSIIFPLEGICYCTGLELKLAINLNVEYEILSGYIIPFKDTENEEEDIKNNNENLIKDLTFEFVDENYIETIKEFGEEINLKLEEILGILENSCVDDIETETETVNENENGDSMYVDEYNNIVYYKNIYTPSKKNGLKVFKESKKDSYAVEFQDKDHVPSEIQENGSTKYNKSHGFNPSPFFEMVKYFTIERLKYPKNSYLNALLKFIVNSGIGQIVRGLSRKKVYDIKTKTTNVIPTGRLTNPIYAGWVTSLIRTVISELLNYIKTKEGKVISATTDGFITDIKDLDSPSLNTGEFSQILKIARLNLSSSDTFLEIKNIDEEGIISWSTRGQLGLSSRIKAMTGFQSDMKIQDLIPEIKTVFLDNKEIRFLQFQLRSAKDIIKKGGSVTPVFSERIFSLKYDNRRLIDGSEKGYYTTKPHTNVEICKLIRTVSKMNKNKFNLMSPISTNNNVKVTDSYKKTFIRMLIRIMYQKPELLSPSLEINSRNEILEIIKSLKIGFSVSLNYISQQKKTNFVPNSIPKTIETESLLKELVKLYPETKINVFFRK